MTTDGSEATPAVAPTSGGFAPPPQRYQAAWAEVNARIQSRLVIQGSFMTGVVVALYLGLVKEKGDIESPADWRMETVVLLPALTFATALWVRHNDAIIGILSAFMQKLEELDDPNQKSGLPGWHDTRYGAIDAALKYRMYSDCAFAIVGVIATLPATILLLERLAATGGLVEVIRWISPLVGVCLGCLGIRLVLTNGSNRRKIKDK